MNDSLTITTIQTDPKWLDKKVNLDFLESKFAKLPPTDLVILPEMFSTGFSIEPKAFAESMLGDTIKWMLNQSFVHNVTIMGSLVIKEKGLFRNRLIFTTPEQTISYYDKRHLFSLSGEDREYTPGEKRLFFKLKDWRILPLICYDLRFPVFSRNNAAYDLLVYVANWPSSRKTHWQNLLIARAIENQSYTIGVNRVGVDGNDTLYPGLTTWIDYSGEIMHQSLDCISIYTQTLDKNIQVKYRERYPFLRDQKTLGLDFIA